MAEVKPKTRTVRIALPRNVDGVGVLCIDTASANGIACSILEIRGKHDWNAGAVAFEQTFAWVAGQLRTPGVPPAPLPGTPVQSLG